MLKRRLVFPLIAITLACCRPSGATESFDVQIAVDGATQLHSVSTALTVDQLLTSAQIELGPLDRISHPLVAQVADGMLITIRRVREEEICERKKIPFQQRVLPKEGVPAGGKKLGQVGAAGIEEACYRIVFEDGEEVDRVLTNEPIIVKAPVPEIVYAGTDESVTPMTIAGRLSYINHNNAWTVAGNTIHKTALTTDKNLDSLVFHQSEAGAMLVFTSETDPTDDFFNELWMVATDGSAEPQRLIPSDVLYASWRPGSSNTLAYSTGERSAGKVGWNALNNLWLMKLDLESGRTLTIEEALPESSGGFYGWWGTHFAWSPLGDRMAWVRPDAFGLVDFERRRSVTLADYAIFQSATTWVWLSSLSWSFDGKLLVSTLHGLPVGNEPAETSPIFDVSVTSVDGQFASPLKTHAGMWASPSFSPAISNDRSEQSSGYLAWLQAREPQNSMNGEYDLLMADRDGSNQRHLFPGPDTAGIRKRDRGLTPVNFAWSPDARHIAITYQGDIWLIDVLSGEALQLTFDGGSSNPVWTG